MKKGFDNDRYIQLQSEKILERIRKFDNKLYLEFGGKLFDDGVDVLLPKAAGGPGDDGDDHSACPLSTGER